MHFLNTILDIVFPSKCVICGKNGVEICINCLSNVPSAERESAQWIFPIFDYRNPSIKKSIWFLKYKGRKSLANIFAKVIYGSILEELSELSILENFTNPILIPIPLSLKRSKERGFNQTEIICRELIKIDNIRDKIPLQFENKILIKTKDTPHQALIKNRNERLKNLIGSFSVPDEKIAKEKIKNRNIILIDDITTTGATLNEARKILKSHGARKIIAFTIAH